jgi:rhodanese-related sulfurtransferase
MRTKRYEKAFGDRRTRDFSLPAAVAMSGAAISPSMGKMTRPAFRFLLALANIRLGVWVPNPRWVAGASRAELRFFRQPRPSYLIRELTGRNRVDAKYLYVTDGGHYENLGLVELLRRGCTRVFCFDASGGQKFSELGEAVAIARSELGVKIEIDPTPLSPKGEPPTARRDVTTGTIHYPSNVKGRLVYARNVMSPGGPWDVRAHQLDDPTFPHDSTVDQLYTDQKFESYRALGAEAGKHAVARMNQIAPSVAPSAAASNGDLALRPQRVRELLETATIQLVDVREDFAHSIVRIRGAKHVEQATLAGRRSELAQSHPVVFHCDEGFRSVEIANDFRAAGWEAFYMEGGIRRWIDDGHPVDRRENYGGPPPA